MDILPVLGRVLLQVLQVAVLVLGLVRVQLVVLSFSSACCGAAQLAGGCKLTEDM